MTTDSNLLLLSLLLQPSLSFQAYEIDYLFYGGPPNAPQVAVTVELHQANVAAAAATVENALLLALYSKRLHLKDELSRRQPVPTRDRDQNVKGRLEGL